MKKKRHFSYFAQNIDCGTRQNREAVLTSTHNLCIVAKIRKNTGIPQHTPVLLYKMGYMGVYITLTCYSYEISCIEYWNQTF